VVSGPGSSSETCSILASTVHGTRRLDPRVPFTWVDADVWSGVLGVV